MKIEFIKRGAATRLILIFAGWSTDARYYSDCTVDGWDTAVVGDYRDLTMPAIPGQYSTVYVFAYSLGVFAAAASAVPATVRIAICGSFKPVSDIHGIPSAVYSGTLEGLDERTLAKFHLRMAGNRSNFEYIKSRLPENLDIPKLREELASIRTHMYDDREMSGLVKNFDRVYIAADDRIFPYHNLKTFWNKYEDTEQVEIKAPHAVDVAGIVKECVPDTAAIGKGFAGAGKSYKENAVVQKEICGRIGEKLESLLPRVANRKMSLLEIGAGNGMLTDEWRRLIVPAKATYVDLTEMPLFQAADEEHYVKTDAERWLEETDARFDIVLSASTIQWFADPVRFISRVRGHLKPGGFALLSTFVKGNLHQLDSLRPSPIIYRTSQDYASVPAEIVDDWESTLKFKSPREMMMHLRLTGVSPKRMNTIGHGDRERRHVSLPLELTYRPLILFVGANLA